MKTSCLWGFSKSWKTCCFYWKDFYLITSRVCLVSTKTQVRAACSSAFRGLFTLNRTQANKGVKSSVHEERLPLACKGRIESRALDAKTWSFGSQPKLAMFEKAWWFHCSPWKVPLATLHWPCPERVAGVCQWVDVYMLEPTDGDRNVKGPPLNNVLGPASIWQSTLACTSLAIE